MASISPTSVSCPYETHTSKHGYVKLTITNITQTNGATNQTTVDYKITVEGTPYVYLYALYVSLGGKVLFEQYDTVKTSWSAGDVIKSGSVTFNNNNDGSLSLTAYIKQLFYYTYSSSRWSSSSYIQETSKTMTCSTIPRYANITSFSVSKYDETSVKYSFSADVSVDWAKYSLDNVNWYDLPNSGLVTGLSPNTSYTFYLALRRTDSGLWSYSNGVSQTTYDYPKPTSLNDFTIGDGATVYLYNPLGRNCTLDIISKENGGVIGTYTGTYQTYINAEFKTADAIAKQYASIPNSQYGGYYARVTYGNSVKTLDLDAHYYIKGTEVPTFSNFTYKDSNTNVTNITGNNQILVKGKSNLQVTISSANKMVAQKSANPKNYTISIDTLNKSVDYSESNITTDVGTVTSSGSKRLNVRAYDTRTLSTLAYKDITVYDYVKPVINANITRLNNFENQTTVKISGTYTRLTIDGTDKNVVTKIQYRYREAGGTWSSWVTLTSTISEGKFTCNDVILSLDNTKAFEFEIQAIDKLDSNTKSVPLDIGQAIFFISSNKKTCYINGQEILMYDVVDEW